MSFSRFASIRNVYCPALPIPPPEFLPVLLGHGSFIRGEDEEVQLDVNRSPLFLIPTSDDFLEMKPSKESQQFWPAKATQEIPMKTSVVFLCISVNTHCQKADMITEAGYTIFDTAAIYVGARSGRKKRIPGCEAPGPRGENITKLAYSRHFIVKDTADHHLGTCEWSNHTAQPHHFSYRKSNDIDREDITKTLEEAFNIATYAGLTGQDVQKGSRRVVVLVGWGAENYHPQIKATSWYRNSRFFQHWDIRLHSLVLERLPTPTYLTCLDVFGIQHRAHGKEIGHNAGNHTAFTIQLLIGLCFLTEAELLLVKSKQSLDPSSKFPGVESVLARDNRPPGSAPLPLGRVPITH
ncbi:hypothetical protein F4782DRAFT_550050 [Xylaria castorea]|nr:hypothetical protein F4782DRAFT_550050 [Xylaria castorea]